MGEQTHFVFNDVGGVSAFRAIRSESAWLRVKDTTIQIPFLIAMHRGLEQFHDDMPDEYDVECSQGMESDIANELSGGLINQLRQSGMSKWSTEYYTKTDFIGAINKSTRTPYSCTHEISDIAEVIVRTGNNFPIAAIFTFRSSDPLNLLDEFQARCEAIARVKEAPFVGWGSSAYWTLKHLDGTATTFIDAEGRFYPFFPDCFFDLTAWRLSEENKDRTVSEHTP